VVASHEANNPRSGWRPGARKRPGETEAMRMDHMRGEDVPPESAGGSPRNTENQRETRRMANPEFSVAAGYPPIGEHALTESGGNQLRFCCHE
jgi:hypothetical protein